MNAQKALLAASFAFVCALACLVAACGETNEGSSQRQGEAGNDASDTPPDFRFVFVPSVDTALIRPHADTLMRFLAERTGYRFQAYLPPTVEESIAALGNGKANVGLLNSFGYLVANRRHGALARLKAVRRGRSYYHGQIIVRSALGIDSIGQLEGKRFAYTSPSSTSGHLLPSAMLREAEVNLGSHVFAGGHVRVVEMVYRGEADAGATYYDAPAEDGSIRDARARLLDRYPDVAEKVKVLHLTHAIPNEPLIFVDSVPEPVRDEVADALMAYVREAEGEHALRALYNIDGFERANDANYDVLRFALEINGVDVDSLIEE